MSDFDDLVAALLAAYDRLSPHGEPVAVRSSATAEDLPDASFAGQQETFLNVVGMDDVLHKMKEVFASLYNDRAISYRVHKGFAHADVALSAGVQRMVRSVPSFFVKVTRAGPLPRMAMLSPALNLNGSGSR